MSEACRPRAGVKYEVAIGESVRRPDSAAGHHTLRYSFKPSSADYTKTAKLKISGQSAEVRVPSTGGKEIVFNGKADAHKKTEFVLICDADGAWRLERLGQSIKNLKAER